MRTILYRGYNKKNQRWIYGFYTTSRDVHFVCPDVWPKGYSAADYEVDRNSIGQFTGLFDKNGTEIYEGDFVRWDRDGKVYLVKFREGMFYASVEECNRGIYGGYPLWTLCLEDQHCMVIGNMYTNPELMRDDINNSK